MLRLWNRVLRGGEFTDISVRDVVPGDIVVIKPGTMYCDLVVVQAQQIVVDESALTGEANPVTKIELDPSTKSATYNVNLHKSNTISAGTVVIEVREDEKNLGLVLKTGSFTTKGELLTDVLSYERHKFKFDDEVKVVLFILLLEAILLLGLVFYFLQDQWVYAWFYGEKCRERPVRVPCRITNLYHFPFRLPHRYFHSWNNIPSLVAISVCVIRWHFGESSPVQAYFLYQPSRYPRRRQGESMLKQAFLAASIL